MFSNRGKNAFILNKEEKNDLDQWPNISNFLASYNIPKCFPFPQIKVFNYRLHIFDERAKLNSESQVVMVKWADGDENRRVSHAQGRFRTVSGRLALLHRCLNVCA